MDKCINTFVTEKKSIFYIALGETFFICWITLHQLKFFRSAIAKKKKKKKLTWWKKSLQTIIFRTWVTFASDQYFDKLSDTNVQLAK